MTSLALLFILSPIGYCHMSMQYPYPRDNDGSYAKWEANEPMIPVHPQICHGLNKDKIIRDGNSFKVGDIIEIDLYGSAPHNGGHCTFWYSMNDIIFTKIIDIKDCTISDSVKVILPKTLPIECETQCTFAFTWIPSVSGSCEIYMNCADIKVIGVLGGNPNPISINFQTNFIDLSLYNYGCIRINDTTHWSQSMGTLKLNYDDDIVINNNDDDVIISNIDNSVCYKNPELAINLNSDISNVGVCGNSIDLTRCDDGYCCSMAGFCGPQYDGNGYINYENGGYYGSKDIAESVYCTNAIGDWRVIECTSTNSKSNASNLIIYYFYFVCVFSFLFIL